MKFVNGSACAMAIGVVAVAACDGGRSGYSGIGAYRVGKTTLKDAPGRCEPTDLPDGRKGTWCFMQPPVGVAGRPADVDLYFLGTEPSAPVIEIQLQVRGCDEEAVKSWLRTNFGAPFEDTPRWAAWRNKHVYVIGELPSEPGRCLVRLLPRSEQAEFDRLKAQAAAKR